MDAAAIAQAVREFDPITAQIKAMSAIDVTAGGALVPPPQQGRKRILPARLGQSKTLLTLGKGWYEVKAKGTCKPGQNPERDKCTAATDDPAAQRQSAGSQTKPAEKAEVAEVAEPAQNTGEETTPPETVPPDQVDTSDAQFEKEWAATVEKAMAEVEANDVAVFPFDAQQAAAEQDWHKQYIEWRWGLTTGPDGQSNKGKYQPTEMDVGAASRFVSGLLNPVLGGAAYVANLYERFIAPRAKTHKPADAAIGDELQAYFDQLNPGQNNKQTAEVALAVLGPEAAPVVKALTKVKPPEPAVPLTQEQLLAMTPAERSKAGAAERAARQRPNTQLRQAAAASLTKPSKPNAAKRAIVAQQRGRAKEKKRQNETPEQRTARIAKERAANIKRRQKQEARMRKYRQQDARQLERDKKKAGKKHLLFQSKTLTLLTKGRWVTMPANGEGGGGTPVYIGEGGEIEKGPAGTVGKKPDQLGDKKPRKEEAKPEPTKEKPAAVERSEQNKPIPKEEARKPGPRIDKRHKLEQKKPVTFQSKAPVKLPTGKVDKQQTDAVFKKLKLKPEAVASLVGAPDDATIIVRGTATGKLYVEVDHPQYRQQRYIYQDTDGYAIKNDEFFLKDAASKGSGIGMEIFGNQIAAARAAGFKKIVTDAAGGEGTDGKPMNGYYTWPRFGYDAPIGHITDSDIKDLVRETFPQAKKISDLMKTQEGRDWWKEHGKATNIHSAEFDLSSGSLSTTVFDAYLAERAKKKG